MSDQRARITYDEAVTTVRLPLGFTDPKPSNFNRLASAAGRLGRAAIPALMLAARDGRTLRAQLCAIKALGMMYHPTAVEARRRISLLELDGDRGRIVRSAFPDGMPFGEAWDVDKVIAAFPSSVPSPCTLMVRSPRPSGAR